MKKRFFLIAVFLAITLLTGFSPVDKEEPQGTIPEEFSYSSNPQVETEPKPDVEVLAERVNSSHPHVWENGICKVCNAKCIHKWDGEYCSVCKIRCTHKTHDYQTLICDTCGSKVWHEYKDGACIHCDKPLVFYTENIPAQYLTEAEHQGTIDHFTMTVTFENGVSAEKKVKVYLPYNYDPEKKYNLLILLPGAGDEEECWIDTVWNYGEGPIVFRNIYDHMIENGDCEPLIIAGVSASSYGPQRNGHDGFNDMPYIMRTQIVPFLVGRYSTYAESIKLEDIVAARKHIGLGGFSNGGLHVFFSGLRENFNIFGNFIALSGMTDASGTAKLMEETGLPVYTLFLGGGLQEGSQDSFRNTFTKMVSQLDGVESGKNAFYIAPNSGHDWKMCSINIYNFLQVAFH